MLRAALELVEGEPFAQRRAGTFNWVDDDFHYSTIVAAILDIAHQLGEQALQASDPALALWAADKADAVLKDHERTHHIRIAAHHQNGDTTAAVAAEIAARNTELDHDFESNIYANERTPIEGKGGQVRSHGAVAIRA